MNVVKAFCDGGIIGKNPSPIGGTWAYAFVDGAGEKVGECCGIVLPSEVELPAITNNLTELYAAMQAMGDLPDGWDGTVYTDSFVTLCRIAKKYASPKFNGIPAPLRDYCMAQRRRLGEYRVVLLDGHPTKDQLRAGKGKRGNPVSGWNVYVDRVCCRLAAEYRERSEV